MSDLSSFQAEAAYLGTLAFSTRAEAGDLARRVAKLRSDLVALRRSHADVVAELPPSLQSHSRVVDVLRALERLASTVEQIQAPGGLVGNVRQPD